MKNIVILISGRGSNMQAIVNAGISDVRIAAVLSNSAAAAGLAWAAERGIPTDSLNHKDFASRGAFDQAMMEKSMLTNPIWSSSPVSCASLPPNFAPVTKAA